MNSLGRRLTRREIGLLKHLLQFSPMGIPVTVPRRYQSALVSLWRLALIEVWYRQDRDNTGGRRTQFVSITIDGWRRIDSILHSPPSRASGIHQGRSDAHDQPSKPEQGEQDRNPDADHATDREENSSDD